MEPASNLIGKLHQTLGKMEVALGSIREAIVWTDKHGTIQWCNRAFDRFFSIPHIGILGKQLYELLPLRDDNQMIRHENHPIGKLIGNTACETRIYEFIKEGERLFLEINGNKISLGDSDDICILSIRNVTDLVKSQDALRAAKDSLETKVKERTVELLEITDQHKSILNEAVDAIITINQKGTIRSFNPSAERIFGHKAKDVIGKNVNIIIPHPLKEQHSKFIRNYLETGQNKVIGIGREVVGVHKNGKEVELYLAVSEVRSENQVIFTGILRDISLQKKAEEAMRQARVEAERANRAKSEFLANMSHEIRTPLNAVLGFSELLAGMVSGEKEKQYLNSIITSGKGLLTIINDILDLSKVEAGKLSLNYESIDLRKLLEEIQQIFLPTIRKKNIELKVVVSPDVPSRLILDEIRVRQVLINLIGNGIKFTHRGYVKIEAALEKGDVAEQKDLSICVSDTGIGIAEDHQSEIFTAFEQQKSDTSKFYGGTGLGLAISKRLIEMMKGNISLKSEEGKGSSFTIRLHDIRIGESSKNDNIGETFSDRTSIRFYPATIMVVDDVASNRDLIKAMLYDTPIQVLEEASAKTAVRRIRVTKPDLVFLDIRMPEMSGFNILNQLRQDPETRKIPVIAMTASVDFDRNRPIDKIHDFDGFLYKPVSVNEILSALSRFIPVEHQMEGNETNNGSRIREEKIHKIVDLPELITELETEILKVWKSFHGALEMDSISTFAAQLRDLGLKHDAPSIIEYSNKINTSVHTFDIESLSLILDQFPMIISRLKASDVSDES